MSCVVCGKELNLGKKYCSHSCYFSHKKPAVRAPKKCPICLSVFSHHNNIYCSDMCSSEAIKKAKKEPVLRICIYCSSEFETTKGGKRRCDACVKNIKTSRKVSAFFIFKRDGFRCIYCGKSSIEDGVKLEIDHVKPKSKHCWHNPVNLVTSCEKCNTTKKASEFSDDITYRIALRNGFLMKDKKSSALYDIEIDFIEVYKKKQTF